MNAMRIFHERSPNQNHFWLKNDLFHVTEPEMTKKPCKLSKWIGKAMIIVAVFIFAILFMWHKFYSHKIVSQKNFTLNGDGKRKTQDERYADYFVLRKNKINPFSVNFTLMNENLCDGRTYLIIIIPSKVQNSRQRHAIRSTWTMASSTLVRHVFLVGYSLNTSWNDNIRKESRVFKDILQGDFMDSYYNLTLNILMGLEWSHLFCYNATFILKADDDTFVNTPYLLHVLQTNVSFDYRGVIIGKLNRDGKVRRNGLWKVGTDSYPFPHYPNYMFGNTYLVSRNIANRLVKASEYMPYLPIEDAYITGILAKSIRTKHQHINGFTFWYDTPPKACDFVNSKRITATKLSPRMMEFIWGKINSRDRKSVV